MKRTHRKTLYLQEISISYMLTKNKIKYIQSLQKKKHREETGCFAAEGNRLVEDLLSSCSCQILVCTQDFLDQLGFTPKAEEVIVTDKSSMEKLSIQKSAQQAIGVFYQKQYTLTPDDLKGKLTLALDTVQDPGNLGTIIRIADWFGIEHIICSKETVDMYNPKTIQATMGALGRIKIHYVDLPELLKQTDLPVYGTFLDGTNLYNEEVTPEGIIVMGNEGNGISGEIEKLVTKKLLIPGYPNEKPMCESLNVGVATSIICAEFRRQIIKK